MKLIASDFDGTLYRNRIITDRDRSAIAEWQARGNLFGIVTGRGAGIIETAAEHGITLDYAITENGAVVLDRDGNILYED
ncbi:MAG: HAD hydrolase family protein [Clostridia bacterium]|nr:HAD hydrolase family protein [Clostridia bacterium]